jgi:hypothetical protein
VGSEGVSVIVVVLDISVVGASCNVLEIGIRRFGKLVFGIQMSGYDGIVGGVRY